MSVAEPAVRIRAMTHADVAPLAEALGWPSYGIDRRWQETVAGYRQMFVAEYEGRSVGCVSVNEREERPRMLHLFALDVAPDVRGRGVGSQLIARVEDEARTRRLDGVYLECAVENENARRLYERLGYAQDGVPFLNSWNRYDARGNFQEEVVETVCRLMKRF